MRNKAVLFAGLFLVSCTQKVLPGEVGVIVSLNGDAKGVHEQVVGVGKHYLSWNEQLYTFPTFTKTYQWTKSPTEGSPTDESISFQSKEGLVVNSDFGITMSVIPEKAAVLFQKYRRTVDELIDSVLRNLVRDALVVEASKMSIEDIISSGKATLLETVNNKVASYVAEQGIKVEKIYIIGEFRLPPAIVSSLNAKIQATQEAMRVENELRKAEAEAKKTIVLAKAQGDALLAKAEAEAKANRLLSDSLTNNLISKMYIEKWDGKLSTYSLGNSSAVPFIQLNK